MNMGGASGTRCHGAGGNTAYADGRAQGVPKGSALLGNKAEVRDAARYLDAGLRRAILGVTSRRSLLPPRRASGLGRQVINPAAAHLSMLRH